jgi:hypothetical protein
MKKERASFCIHSDNANRDNLNNKISKLLSSLESRFNYFKMDTSLTPVEDTFEVDLKKEFYLLPNYVNYVIQSFEIPHFNHPDIPKIAVMSNFTRQTTRG